MYKLTIQNKYGDLYELTNNPKLYITRVSGLTPAAADINMDSLATADGDLFNSSKVGSRNIVINLKYRLAPEPTRQELYKVFKTKQPVRVFYKTETKDVYIDGYVETFEGDLFELGQSAQISIVCPQPYFKKVTDDITEFLLVHAALEFPVEFPEAGIPFSTIENYAEKSVINAGEAETGVIIQTNVRGSVTNPAFYNLTTGEGFTLNFAFQTGDLITINTNDAQKEATLLRDGTEINLLNYITQGSRWFTLTIGDNIFSYTAALGGEYMDVRFTVTPLFEGI